MNRFLRTSGWRRASQFEPLERRDLLSGNLTHAAAAAEAPSVQFRLTIAAEDGVPLSEVEVGDSFQLQVQVQDLRGVEASGVFSPYLDVVYDASLAQPTGDVQFGDVYTNARSADTSQPGLIDEAGAFGSFQSFQTKIDVGGAGGDAHFLWSVPMVALAPGKLFFAGNPADLRPLHDLYVYDNIQLVSADRVDYGQASITIDAAKGLVVDNGAAGFQYQGAWTRYRRLGHDRDLHFSARGNGSDQARWSLPADPGTYRIATTWRRHPNRASDAPYRIFADDQMLKEIRVNQTVQPNDMVFAGSSWEVLGTFEVTNQPLSVVLSDDANGYVIADAVWFERLDETALTARLELRHDGNRIESGAVIDFGDHVVGDRAFEGFTLVNRSASTIVFHPLQHLALPAGFRLAADVQATVLAPGAATNFRLELLTTAPLQASGAVTMPAVVGDGSLQLQLRGSVRATGTRPLPHALVQIVDDEAGFTTLGHWTRYFGIGRHGDVRFSAKGVGQDVARWSFDVEPGTYRVATSWVAHPNRATDAPYEVRTGGQQLGLQRLNQRFAPNDFTADGMAWELIGMYEVRSDSLVVQLTDAANGFVIADAVRVERIEAAAATTPGEIQIVDNGEPGFQSMGHWKDYAGTGRSRDVTFSGAGGGGDVARWTFTVTPGRYRVSTTWSPHANRATDASYEIRDSKGGLGITTVNQQRIPADFLESTTRWEDLGTVTIDGAILVVELTDAANGFVIADAVRIERV